MAQVIGESEDRDFGSTKTGSTTFKSAADINARLGPEATVHPGSWAGAIVAEGTVFRTSFRPVGMFAEAKVPDVVARFRLDAEDVLIALDARTGMTLRKAAEPGTLMLALNGDWWTRPNPAARSGVAARIRLDVTCAQGTLAGSYRAELGIAWTPAGRVSGALEPPADKR